MSHRTSISRWTPKRLPSLSAIYHAPWDAAALSLVSTPGARDRFDRADGELGTAESGQSWVTYAGAPKIVSKAISCTGTEASASTDAGCVDQIVRCSVSCSGGSREIGVSLRGKANATDTTELRLLLRTGSSTAVKLYRVTPSGGEVLLASGVASGNNNVNTVFDLTVQAVGNVITVWRNALQIDLGGAGGTYVLTGDDITNFNSLTSTKAGVRISAGSGTATWEDFRCDNASGAAFQGTAADYSGGAHDLTQSDATKKPSLLPDPTYRTVSNGAREILTGTDFYNTTKGWVLVAIPYVRTVAAVVTAWLAVARTDGITRYWYVGKNGTKLRYSQRNNDTADTLEGDTVLVTGQELVAVFRSDDTAITVAANGAAQALTVVAGANNGDWSGDFTRSGSAQATALLARPLSTVDLFARSGIGTVMMTSAVPSAGDEARASRWASLTNGMHT